MIKRLLVLTLTLAALTLGFPTQSSAQKVVGGGKTGSWIWIAGITPDNTKVCFMATELSNGRSLFIKHYQDTQFLLVELQSKTWNIPANAKTSIAMQFDNHDIWAAPQGVAKGTTMRFSIMAVGKNIENFAQEFYGSSSLRISFLAGNEPAWVVPLQGSGAIIKAFSNCVTTHSGGGKAPTQPFDTTPTTPAAPAAPTQPYKTT